MKQNIGIINALIRLTAGFTILAWIISKMVRRPYRDSYILVAMLAAMKIGEGILKYCPITDLFERYQGNYMDGFDYESEFDLDFDDLRQQPDGDGDVPGASSYNPS